MTDPNDPNPTPAPTCTCINEPDLLDTRDCPIHDTCTCYLGDPDDPTRDTEACAACDYDHWQNPVYIIYDDDL